MITRKAARLIEEADVVAYHSGTHGRSIARSIAVDLLPPNVIEEALVYPVTTGKTSHTNGYRGAIEDFYDESAERLAESDVLRSAMGEYLHDRVVAVRRAEAEVSAGIDEEALAAKYRWRF